MKKTTKSNPLKYFNDAADARKKTVIAGNNKLVKAQFGKTTPMQDYVAKYKDQPGLYNEKNIAQDTLFGNNPIDNWYNPGFSFGKGKQIEDLKEANYKKFYDKKGNLTKDKNKLKEIKEKQVDYEKKGGQIKSKKK